LEETCRIIKPYVNQNSNLNRLERALSAFLSPRKPAAFLSKILIQACKVEKVSYGGIEQIAKDNTEDVLLQYLEWRLLPPARSARGTLEWEDALLLPKSGEMYKVPNVVEYLVEEAIQAGRWNVENAIAEISKLMGEPEWEKMPELVEKLGKESKDCKINAIQIKKICRKLALEDRVDPLIAELKGSGVMSPKVSSLTEVIRESSPIYELNPSVFANRTGKCL